MLATLSIRRPPNCSVTWGKLGGRVFFWTCPPVVTGWQNLCIAGGTCTCLYLPACANVCCCTSTSAHYLLQPKGKKSVMPWPCQHVQCNAIQMFRILRIFAGHDTDWHGAAYFLPLHAILSTACFLQRNLTHLPCPFTATAACKYSLTVLQLFCFGV